MIVIVGVNYAFVDCETCRPCYSTRLPNIRLPSFFFSSPKKSTVCLLRLRDKDMNMLIISMKCEDVRIVEFFVVIGVSGQSTILDGCIIGPRECGEDR